MYVIPFVMGHLNAEQPMFGVEITDSEYVVASMRVMARCGINVLRRIEELDADFVPALHSVGAPLEPGQQDVAVAVQRHQVHRPVPRGADDLVLRLGLRRQRPARQEVLLPAHRLGHGPRRGLARRAHAHPQADLPEKQSYYVAAAFPSACGKTNLAMLDPTIPGWKVETLGDDIAWMRFGEDGRLYAVNPEFGFFGVAPGTNEKTNPNAMRTIEKGNSVFTNVALTDDGDIWWEGMENEPGPRHRLEGQRLDARGRPNGVLSSHPNSRYCTPIEQCPILAPEYDDPQGRADLGDLLRWPPQDDDPAGDRVPRLGARHVHGRDPLLGDDRRRHRPGRRRPPRPDGDAAVHRLQRRRLLQPLDQRGQGRRRHQAAEDLLRQLVPPRRRRRLPVARLRRELAACSSGPSSASRAGPPRSRPRSATCRPRSRSTPTAST